MKFTRIILPIITAGLLSLVTIVVVQTGRISDGEQSSTKAVGTLAQAQGDRRQVRMIRFVLWDNGLYPRSMRVDQGLINLAIEDKTNMSEGLAVERVVGGGGHERHVTVRKAQNHWRGRELVRLTPGQYVVYDVSKPDNKADLVVEP